MLFKLALICVASAESWKEWASGVTNVVSLVMAEAEMMEESVESQVTKMFKSGDSPDPATPQCEACGFKKPVAGVPCCIPSAPFDTQACSKYIPLSFFRDTHINSAEISTWKRDFATCIGANQVDICRSGAFFDPCQPAHTIPYPSPKNPEMYCLDAAVDDNDYLTCYQRMPTTSQLVCKSSDDANDIYGGWQAQPGASMGCNPLGEKMIVEKPAPTASGTSPNGI